MPLAPYIAYMPLAAARTELVCIAAVGGCAECTEAILQVSRLHALATTASVPCVAE